MDDEKTSKLMEEKLQRKEEYVAAIRELQLTLQKHDEELEKSQGAAEAESARVQAKNDVAS